MTVQLVHAPTETPRQVRALVDQGQSVVVHGEPGTGRSTAVEEAVAHREVVWIKYGHTADRAHRALLGAARSVRREARGAFLGRDVLRDDPVAALGRHGLRRALEVLDDATGGRLVVVDDADRLLQPARWQDDLWAGADAVWSSWLERREVVLIGDHRVTGDWARLAQVDHRIAAGSVPLRWTDGDERWNELARQLLPRFPRFAVARAVAHLTSDLEFDALRSSPDLLRELGRILRTRSPRKALDLGVLSLVDGVPSQVAARLLAALNPGDEVDLAGNERLKALHASGLVTERRGVVAVNPALIEADALIAPPPNRLSALAQALLAELNEVRTIHPDQALQVLAAHTLAVRAGDVDLALRTAVAHGSGLIEVARSLSEDRRFEAAWQVYDGVVRMLPPELAETTRPRSYALNYRAWNGLKAERCDEARALADVEEAVGLWPDNAAWHGHHIRLLVRLGRYQEALAALHAAELVVPAHDRRAGYLRVEPAWNFCRVGLVQTALEVLDLRGLPWRRDEDAVQRVRGLLSWLGQGRFKVSELEAAQRRVVFRTPQALKLERVPGVGRWLATLPELRVHATSSDPQEALERLALQIAEDVQRLVGTPTPWLAADDIYRKGVLDAAIDLLQSDVGLQFATERWFVGRVEEGSLLVQGSRVAEPIPWHGAEPSRPGLWFGLVDIDRGGFPVGPVKELAPAGSGLSADEIQRHLSRLAESTPHAE